MRNKQPILTKRAECLESDREISSRVDMDSEILKYITLCGN